MDDIIMVRGDTLVLTLTDIKLSDGTKRVFTLQANTLFVI